MFLSSASLIHSPAPENPPSSEGFITIYAGFIESRVSALDSGVNFPISSSSNAMGMVNAVVPFDKLEETTVDWAKTIMKRSPFAIRMIKRALNAELDGQHGLMEFAGDATLMYYMMDEAQEGKNAFLEKRDPNFDQYPMFP